MAVKEAKGSERKRSERITPELEPRASEATERARYVNLFITSPQPAKTSYTFGRFLL